MGICRGFKFGEGGFSDVNDVMGDGVGMPSEGGGDVDSGVGGEVLGGCVLVGFPVVLIVPKHVDNESLDSGDECGVGFGSQRQVLRDGGGIGVVGVGTEVGLGVCLLIALPVPRSDETLFELLVSGMGFDFGDGDGLGASSADDVGESLP